MLNGMLLVDKPSGVTSHDVVQVIRRKLAMRRIGHTGTLDPMAEGLLILLVGGATKHQQAFQGHLKIYEATVRLGVKTDTGDATGAPVHAIAVPRLERIHLVEVMASFEGPLAQIPPAFSAVKIRGRPAYWWTRRQQPVTLAERIVHIFQMSLLQHDDESITFRVRCSAGTYVRTLAESIAERLGTVGHLARLVRVAAGPWTREAAQPLSWFAQASQDSIARHLLPIGSSTVGSSPLGDAAPIASV